jgi:hypothetical protein
MKEFPINATDTEESSCDTSPLQRKYDIVARTTRLPAIVGRHEIDILTFT